MTEQLGLFDDPRPHAERPLPPTIDRDADLSDDGVYRYRLSRHWGPTEGPARFVRWIMLNPSTADADVDDRTIGRCMEFTRTWGYDGIVVVNLYALRATNPDDLWTHPDPVGPDNLEHLANTLDVAAHCEAPTIAAWGVNARDEAVNVVTHMAYTRRVVLRCLGVTKHGAPRHPLFVRGDTLPIPLDPNLRTTPRRKP